MKCYMKIFNTEILLECLSFLNLGQTTLKRLCFQDHRDNRLNTFYQQFFKIHFLGCFDLRLVIRGLKKNFSELNRKWSFKNTSIIEEFSILKIYERPSLRICFLRSEHCRGRKELYKSLFNSSYIQIRGGDDLKLNTLLSMATLPSFQGNIAPWSTTDDSLN